MYISSRIAYPRFLLRSIWGSVYPIYFSRGWPIYEPSISHLAQIWAKMPIFLWKSGPYLGHWFIYGPHSQKTYRVYTAPCCPEEDFLAFMARLAAEGDTADRLTAVPVVVVRGVDSVRIEAQAVGVVAIVADRGPVEAAVACVAQVFAWPDTTAPDKHQRRLHNSIRIS